MALLDISSSRHRHSSCFHILLALALLCQVALLLTTSESKALTPRATSNPFVSVSKDPREWMKEPLFHSPKVFLADYAEMKRKLKLFIYPPHPKFEDEIESRMFGYSGESDRLPKGSYASEDWFFRNVYETELRTANPNEAHFFVLPFSAFHLRFSVGHFNVSSFVADFVGKTVKRRWPFWNRTAGADHFYATCHDVGVLAGSRVPEFGAGGALQIVCPADRAKKWFVPSKDFGFPQIFPRFRDEPGCSATERKASKVLAFYSGSGSNSKVRDRLLGLWGEDDEILLGEGRVLQTKLRGKAYFDYFKKAKYCLHVRGIEKDTEEAISDLWKVKDLGSTLTLRIGVFGESEFCNMWLRSSLLHRMECEKVHTARIGDAIFFGCVPVIIADQFELPFKDVLDWREFAVIVVEADLPNLKNILKSIPDERYEQMHATVETVRPLFAWNSPPKDYDTFHMIMYDLWTRRFVTRPALELNTKCHHGSDFGQSPENPERCRWVFQQKKGSFVRK